jgi:hypothetical protein
LWRFCVSNWRFARHNIAVGGLGFFTWLYCCHETCKSSRAYAVAAAIAAARIMAVVDTVNFSGRST